VSGYALVTGYGTPLGDVTVGGLSGKKAFVFCPTGTRALGGGHWQYGNMEIVQSAPIMLGINTSANEGPAGTQNGSGWVAEAYNHGVFEGVLWAFAVCATVS
jgi:hypothetical protein